MTAKEALLELVDDLSEDEARHAYDLIRYDREITKDPEPLSADERAAIERGLAALRAGRVVDQDEIEREFGSGK